MDSLRLTERPAVLLTGATSYLGVSLARHLQRSGCEVTALVRPTSQLDRFRDVPPNIQVHDGSTGSLVEIVGDVGPDVVVHLAATYRREHSADDVVPLIEANVRLGAQLLEAMRRTGCGKLVTAGTHFQHFGSQAYRPLNLYAATKQAFEDILGYYVDAHDFDAITLVLFDIYGPGDRRPKLMEAIRQALVSGEPVELPERDLEMDLVYVDDAVAAFARAISLLHDGATRGLSRFAVSSPERCRLSELVSMFEEVAGKSVPHAWGRYPTQERSIVAPWTGSLLPGWEPRWSLREGIRQLLAGS